MSKSDLCDRRLLLTCCSVVVTACNTVLGNEIGHLRDAAADAVSDGRAADRMVSNMDGGGTDASSDGDMGSIDAVGVIGTEGTACDTESALACAGHAQNVVLICTNHEWALFGKCPGKRLCDSTGPDPGSCQDVATECEGKTPGKFCSGRNSVTCGPDFVTSTTETCPECTGQGVCSALTGCASDQATCGPNGNGDCCDSASLVQGGTFNRSNDATYPATVSDFLLDDYEITVGRFRKFVAGYPGNLPAQGAGKNPNNKQEVGWLDHGWNDSWHTMMPADATVLRSQLNGCDPTHSTWTDIAGGGESLPIVCITWYEAFAFCVWDGGRLPSEAEWNYAAAGGSEQRAYPWSNPPSDLTIDDTYAVYCGGSCASTHIVGSKSPKGDGKWGQSDLAGNVLEWVADANSPYSNPCVDCFNSTGSPGLATRGGSYNDTAVDALAATRRGGGGPIPWSRYKYLGARCARSP